MFIKLFQEACLETLYTVVLILISEQPLFLRDALPKGISNSS
jgi:hypothetical protein